jgi:hypothetical protein
MKALHLTLGSAVLLALAAPLPAASLTDGLKEGTVELKSAGPLAFGPEGVLFIGDPAGAAVYAVATGDTKSGSGDIQVAKVDEKIAARLGTQAAEMGIADLAINPVSGNAYLSVRRGRGPDAPAVIVRVGRDGNVEEVGLKGVKCAKAEIASAPDEKDKGKRTQSITGLRFVKDKVIVAGLSNEEFASTLRVIPFPFTEGPKPTGLQIFHGAHGRLETGAPIRTFTPYEINGEAYILAAYTCTPLVKIPVADLKPGSKVKGTTVAELGNGNQPLDLIVYNKDGKEYVLVANSKRGVMKVATEGIEKIEPINAPVRGTAGLKYQTIETLKGVEHMDRLDKEKAVILVRGPEGVALQTIALP